MSILQLLSFIAFCCGSPDTALTVTIRPESDVAGRTFTVGEIATIAGTDKALTAQVAAVEVGASPLPGLSRPLFPGDILTHLRYNRVDVRKINFVYPPSIKIRRAGKEIPPADIVKTASDRLMALYTNDEGITIEAGALSARWVVAPGKLDYLPGEPRIQTDGCGATVPVTVMVDGKVCKQVDIPFKIKHVVTALVAKRVISAHTVITPDDVTTAKVEVLSGGQAILTDPMAVVGKRTKRQIGFGAPLTDADVENAPVVTAGTKVTLEIVSAGLCVTAPAVARESGAVGDRIRVFATDTKKILTCIIVDPKTVRMEE